MAHRLLEGSSSATHAEAKKFKLQTGQASQEVPPHRQWCLPVCQASTDSTNTCWLSPSLLHSFICALQYCFVEHHTQPGSIRQPHHTFDLFFETPLELIEQAYTVVVGTGSAAGAGHLFNCTERAASVCK